MASKYVAKIGDKAWQVEWQEHPKIADAQEWDIDDIKTHVRRFHNRSDAIALVKTLVVNAWGAVELHEVEFTAFDELDLEIHYPRIGYWEDTGDGDYFNNGDEIE